MPVLDVERPTVADLRERALADLRAALPAPNLEAAQRCSERLLTALPHHDDLARNLVLVAYGGGKDSAYTLAFVRAMHLLVARAHGSTFRMRVVTNRHAGMPRAVLENVERSYRALHMSDDPGCELLLIDGDEVSTFDVDSPQRPQVVERNRTDILMTGHRTFADGRPTFCNACNFSVVNSFGLAASYGDGADLVITGDSSTEQRQYALWVGRLAKRLTPTAPPAGAGTGPFLAQIDAIAQSYFADIHGAGAPELATRRVSHDVPAGLACFSIYGDTEYAAGDHLALLTDFLGFQFDDIAFSFTESDCGNPALMAHLRALKCERVYQRSYAEGIAEYVEFALDLMRSKDFPPQLVAQMRARYAGADAVERMRLAANAYAEATFGLSEQQLVCMAYSPFAERGHGLARYLGQEQLDWDAAAVHRVLDGADDPALTATLEHVSGLALARLRVLYRSALHRPGTIGPRRGVIDTVLAGDPHKATIHTRHSVDGPGTLEQISGR